MISVIVPVFNCESYIEHCLRSIINQSFIDYELILVDDGSMDSSGTICDEYASMYDMVSVIHQINLGQIVARKAGVEKAKGDYITFVDSDDWIDQDYLSSLYELTKSEEEISLVSTDLIYNRIGGVIAPDGKMATGIFSKKQIEEVILKSFIYDETRDSIVMRHTMPGMLFKTSILKRCIGKVNKNIRFDEDGLLVCNYLMESDKLLVSRYKGYHYRENEQSVNHSSDLSFLDSLKMLTNEYCKIMGKRVDKETIKRQVLKYIQSFSIQCLANEFDCKYASRFIMPFELLTRNMSICVYGAGLKGREFVREARETGSINIVHWVDKNYDRFDPSIGVESITVFEKIDFDIILIAIEDRAIQRQVEKDLLDRGVPFDKIWPLESKYYFIPR